LVSWVPPAWFDRYGTQISDYRLPVSQAERTQLAEQIGTDGRQLLTLVHAPTAPAWVRAIPAVETLQQVWQQQYHAVPPDAPMRLRPAEDLLPAGELICSPYDPDARYRRKRDTEWVGYAVHLTESCDEDLPHVLTNIETTAAPGSDNQMTSTIHTHLAAHHLTPREHYVDAGYVTAEQLVRSQQQGIDLVGPVSEDPSWQARAGAGFGAAAFRIDWEREQATCPQGKTSASWQPSHDSDKHPVVRIRWAHADCGACPVRSQCVQSRRPRALTIRGQAEHAALQTARARQHTEAFKEAYQRRAGCEGTINQGVQMGALRRSRSVGLTKTTLLHLLIGTAMNVVRIAAWLADVPRARTRRSPFARLAPAIAA
jgi:transposase